MSLAVMYAPMAVDSRRPETSSGFPRLARDAKATASPQRPRVEAPRTPEVFDEEDAERWDGMA